MGLHRGCIGAMSDAIVLCAGLGPRESKGKWQLPCLWPLEFL